MIPRSRLDIGWGDLVFALRALIRPPDREASLAGIAAQFSPEKSLVCLSVRSGFDALLTALALPRGSEILVSAVTIRDMVRIIEAHGLIAVPVDLDVATLEVDMDALERARTPATRAILVAHLFGSRMSLDAVTGFAEAHQLLLLEDCAQAWTGDDYRGHARSDVAMFSFGFIKTATALGGGVLCCRDTLLAEAVAAVLATQPVQQRRVFGWRLLKCAALSLLSATWAYTLFVGLCRVMRVNHDALIAQSLRGFAGADFFARIRQQISAPMLALLGRRLSHAAATRARVAARTAAARRLTEAMPAVQQPGLAARQHTHWVMPVLSRQPDEDVVRLWAAGIDATRGASSLYLVPPADGTLAQATGQTANAAAMMARVLYLPALVACSEARARRIAGLCAARITPPPAVGAE